MGVGQKDAAEWNFAQITAKQREVLNLLAEGRTSKEIAFELDVSESAVVQRIENLRSKAGGVPRAELARLYRSWLSENLPCNDLTGKIFQLPEDEGTDHYLIRNEADSRLVLSDSIPFKPDDPWAGISESRIVPEALDGKHAVLFRWLCVVGISLGLIVTVLVLLAVAQSLGEIF